MEFVANAAPTGAYRRLTQGSGVRVREGRGEGPSAPDPPEAAAAAADGPQVGEVWELTGLRSRPDLNGRRVEVKYQDVGSDGPRIAVRVLGGGGAGVELFKAKAANLRPLAMAGPDVVDLVTPSNTSGGTIDPDVLSDSGGSAGTCDPDPESRALVVADVAEGLVNQEELEALGEVRLGYVAVNCVGLRYYSGTVHEGEVVMLVREPFNPYDNNAIRVNNMSGVQVGHIKREQAETLAPILDEKVGKRLGPAFNNPRVKVEAILPYATRSKFSMKIELSFYGMDVALKDGLRKYLQKKGLQFTEFSLLDKQKKGKAAGALVLAKKRLSEAQSQQFMDDMFKDMEEMLRNLPPPPHLPDLLCELHPHQKQGLSWMLKREKEPEMDPFWEKTKEEGKVVYFNNLTNSVQQHAPQPVHGGILADDMGLGKTVMTLGLVLANRGGPTLIVCPVSVLSNWELQSQEHVARGALRVLLYHGPNRDRSPKRLEKYDVVVTSYSVAQSEHNPASNKRKRDEGLFGVEWHRIVLDEAHTIRNYRSKTFKACEALGGAHRWGLTGTPLQNRTADVFALFKFLKLNPLSDFAIWTRALGRPMKQGQPLGFERLRLLMKGFALRRTKEILGNLLPTKTVELHTIQLDAFTRKKYDCLFESARSMFSSLLSSGDAKLIFKNYSGVLEILMRLRQSCCDPSLVPAARYAKAQEVLDLLSGRRGETISVQEAEALFKILKEKAPNVDAEEAEECAVCLSTPAESALRVLRTCKHTFCHDCLVRHMNTCSSNNVARRCPLCRGEFSERDVLGFDDVRPPGAAEEEAQAAAAAAAAAGGRPPPPKVKALLDGLKAMKARDRGSKAVVFSQFTSFLAVIQGHLEAHGYQCVRLTGGLSQKKRAAAIERFQTDDAVTVFLVSLKAGGQGLNLTRANTVFLMDIWWSPAAEAQAMDRVHRIGQKREVLVVRYVCAGTVEERVERLQEAKLALGEGLHTKMSDEAIRKSKLDDLKDLFGVRG